MDSMEKEAMNIYSKLESLQGGINKSNMKDLEDFILNGSLSDFFCLVSFV